MDSLAKVIFESFQTKDKERLLKEILTGNIPKSNCQIQVFFVWTAFELFLVLFIMYQNCIMNYQEFLEYIKDNLAQYLEQQEQLSKGQTDESRNDTNTFISSSVPMEIRR